VARITDRTAATVIVIVATIIAIVVVIIDMTGTTATGAITIPAAAVARRMTVATVGTEGHGSVPAR
jgi:hypothetical protein